MYERMLRYLSFSLALCNHLDCTSFIHKGIINVNARLPVAASFIPLMVLEFFNQVMKHSGGAFIKNGVLFCCLEETANIAQIARYGYSFNKPHKKAG